MPDLLTISGLLNGNAEPGKGIWWAAMSRKIDEGIPELPYSQQAEAKLVADQFWDRALKQATPPQGKEREMYEHMFLPDRSRFHGFAEVVKRKGPVFTAEKCLEIAEKLLAKGNKKMAYLWALRAVKTATAEKKSGIRKRAEELAKRLKAEMAVQAVAGFLGEDDINYEAIKPLVNRLIKARKQGLHELAMAIGFANTAREKALKANRPDIAMAAIRMIRAVQIAGLAAELGL
jgi:hypothetical protein